MKKILFPIFLAFLMLVILNFAPDYTFSHNEMSVVPDVYATQGEEDEPLSFDYVKYGTAPHAGASSSAMDVSDWLYKEFKMIADVVPVKTNTPVPYAVYGWSSDIPLTLRLLEAVDLPDSDDYAWGIAYEDGVLALYANSKIAFSDPEGIFNSLLESLSEYSVGGEFRIPNGYLRAERISKAEYSRLVEEKRAMEREAMVDELKSKLETEFTDAMFDPNGLGFTEKLTEVASKTYSAPAVYPELGEHPRVLFTANMIPGIREALEDPLYKNARVALDKLLDSEVDGILGSVVTTSTYSYNFSVGVLNVIQAKAFAYAVFGDEYQGYSAIYALLNFMKTLDYNFKQIDATRDFGAIIYTAACVYDWCYSLLSEDTARRILLGVEHVACRGTVDEPEKGSFGGVKLEIGFPPTGQGAVTGHGCEMALLRNFLALSIAIYDEYPDWYELCAGRFFEEYVEPRNLYYSAGMYPQGTQYNCQRFHCDLYSAALIKAISGKNPYDADGMRDTAYGLFATVSDVGEKGTFFVGDIRRTNTQVLPKTGECAMMASYLFSDPILRGIAEWREYGFSKFTSGNENLTPTEFFAFASDGLGISEGGIVDMPAIIYNGGWYGQISVRDGWREGAAVVLMKVQERTAANHDHAAAGTFQIYYKGILTGDMGDYAGDVYGSDHCKYFLRSTVSHNGLLIYDESKKDTLDGYYVGGQRTGLSEPSTLDAWLGNSTYDTGEVTGYSYGYKQNGDTEFAYISGDITKAYDTTQASYVGRSMLTVYTGDEDSPMVMFVFDRINSVSADFVKKFLLQVPTVAAPKINENTKTVEITNGKGKLLLTNIIGADQIVALGGTDKNGNRLNYQINGKQLDFSTAGVVNNRDSWGRVELVASTGSTIDNFFNVICVGDDGKKIPYSPEAFAAHDKTDGEERIFEGARIGGVAALFANSDSRTSSEVVFTIPGDGLVSTYIAGLYTGTWCVSLDGQAVGTVYSTNDSGMVKITVPAGKEITLAPSEDVRPANSGEIIYVTGGATFDKKPSQFYPLGEEFELPTDISRGSDIFDGWYTDAAFTNRITKIPEDAPRKLVVYAKWLTVPFLEDFSETVLDGVTTEKNIGGARYSCDKKENSYFQTDSYRGTLLWVAGSAGPHITVNKSSIGGGSRTVAELGTDSVTFSFSLAKIDGKAPQSLMMRIRDEDNLPIYIAHLSDGVLRLGESGGDAPAVLTLTNEIQTVNITVDFKTLTLIARDGEGNFIAERVISVPEERKTLSGVEWMSLFNNEIINIRSQSAGSLTFSRIAVLPGDKFLTSEPAVNEIIYVTNGGNFENEPDVAYTPGEEKILPTDITRDGYVFLGWYASPDFEGEPITKLPANAVGEYPLYASWARHEIVYVTNGGDFDVEPETAYTPGEEKILATDISKDGYVFLGWYTSPDFEGEPITKLPATAFDVFEVYARWELDGNFVVYDPNGGTLIGVDALPSGELAEPYVYGAEHKLSLNVSKADSYFLGWFTSDGTRVEYLSADSVGAVYVVARWSVSFISEDYSKTQINTTERANENGITYSHDSKTGNSFVTDSEGEYLTFTASAAGPHITANASSSSYADMDSGLLSFTLSLASVEGEDVMDFIVRARDKGGCAAGTQCDLVILRATSGSVYLGDAKKSVKLFDITSEFTTARVVLDFNNLKLSAYSADGSVLAEVDITVPQIHGEIGGDEWQSMFKTELFNLRASGAGSVKISEISVVEGNAFVD